MTDPAAASPHEPEPALPLRLVEDLRRLHDTDLFVPATLEDAILSAARRHFARQRRSRLILRLAGLAAAAAAAALALAVLWPAPRWAVRRAPTETPGIVQTTPPADLHAHRITILDAFALARHLKAGDSVGREWDFDGDGIVDRRDVDALALAAVRLDGGT